MDSPTLSEREGNMNNIAQQSHTEQDSVTRALRARIDPEDPRSRARRHRARPTTATTAASRRIQI